MIDAYLCAIVKSLKAWLCLIIYPDWGSPFHVQINISIVRNRIHDGGMSIGHESYSWFCVYIRTIYTYIHTYIHTSIHTYIYIYIYSTWYSHDIPSAVDWIPWIIFPKAWIPSRLTMAHVKGTVYKSQDWVEVSNSMGLPQSGWFLSWKIILRRMIWRYGFTLVNLHVFETNDRKVTGMMGIGLGESPQNCQTYQVT